jgi:hypothetical protein
MASILLCIYISYCSYPSFLWLVVFYCVYIYIYHIVVILPNTDGHLSWFLITAIVHNNSESRCFFTILISLPLGIYPVVGRLLDHMVVLFLVWGPSILFSLMAALIYILPNRVWVPFSLPPCQYLLLFVFLIRAILIERRWYIIAVLICISLMVSDAEHFSVSVGHLYVLFWGMFIWTLTSLLNEILGGLFF